MPALSRQDHLLIVLLRFCYEGLADPLYNTLSLLHIAHTMARISNEARLEIVKVLEELEDMMRSDMVPPKPHEAEGRDSVEMKARKYFEDKEQSKSKDGWAVHLLGTAIEGTFGGIVLTEHIKRELLDIEKLRLAISSW